MGAHSSGSGKKMIIPAAMLAACICIAGCLQAAPPGPGLPPELASRLAQYRQKDDLKDWIYAQVQWVAQRPGPRAGSLKRAEDAAWRRPRNDQEVQAWLDLLVNEGYAFLIAGDIVHSTDAYTA